ncbi:MAG: hypothetical protein NZ571_16510, partial [Anaerolineae bacterium]|nr:hypothetical protein [Anaerolineae bacterium]
MTLQHDIHWLIEGVLIFSRTSGDGSIEEMGAIDARLLELIRVGTPPVHILSDLSNLGRMPFDVVGMQRSLKHMKDPNLGLIVVYGTTRLAANFL